MRQSLLDPEIFRHPEGLGLPARACIAAMIRWNSSADRALRSRSALCSTKMSYTRGIFLQKVFDFSEAERPLAHRLEELQVFYVFKAFKDFLILFDIQDHRRWLPIPQNDLSDFSLRFHAVISIVPLGVARGKCCESLMVPGKIEVSSSSLVKRAISSSTGMRATPKNAIDWSLKQRNVKVNVVMEFDNIETIKQAIAIDAGVSILPRPTVSKEVGIGSLAAVPLAIPDLVRPVGIIYRKQKRLSPTITRFIDSLRKAEQGVSD